MPIYMDRHDVSETVTAEHVAKLHIEDIKIEHLYGCKGLTYWFDDQRKMAFCLIEAPNKQAIEKMHHHAHGEIPHKIIEVDSVIVESFLGRIEDPKKAENELIHVINDPAFRTIMNICLKPISLKDNFKSANSQLFQRLYAAICNILKEHGGHVVRKNSGSFLVSFQSVSRAVECAVHIQKEVGECTSSNTKVSIGLDAGVPVTDREDIFEATIKSAQRMSDFVKGNIVVSTEVKSLLEQENPNHVMDLSKIRTINSAEEKFLNHLIDYLDKTWQKTDLHVGAFGNELGFSKSQFYRKMIEITDQSPNIFLKGFRLQRALQLLHHRQGTISEIAFETGFNSPAYFSKCFQANFGILPSKYLQKYFA
ncbi:nickel-binding protein [Sediminicola sp. 1XM1-17]|uniref:nickel-binding protein n=1 Tax=Sediminicola sp. 1XM1-17 TaxID=3127702 RepID=UPI003077A020